MKLLLKLLLALDWIVLLFHFAAALLHRLTDPYYATWRSSRLLAVHLVSQMCREKENRSSRRPSNRYAMCCMQPPLRLVRGRDAWSIPNGRPIIDFTHVYGSFSKNTASLGGEDGFWTRFAGWSWPFLRRDARKDLVKILEEEIEVWDFLGVEKEINNYYFKFGILEQEL